MKALSPLRLQKNLLTWFDRHGRHALPWQINKTPYRVWLSEIMLQQTQVKTVIPYFERFTARFPTLEHLAAAQEDDVLHLWTGLGYYSRARNLHRAAKMIMQTYEGQFPNTIEQLQTLPGIGQSTAGAILSIAFNQPVPILDGNVKCVLTRLYGITQPINQKTTEKQLWEIATKNTPAQRVGDYTQAIMDLGATCCTRKNPTCHACPFTKTCLAFHRGLVEQLPVKEKTKPLPTKTATFLICKTKSHVLLYKRPSSGIWGGLYSLPELSNQASHREIRQFCKIHFPTHPQIKITSRTPFRHTFTHYHLELLPVLIELSARSIKPPKIVADQEQIWYNLTDPQPVGLPKPIQSILRELAHSAIER
jgi:A/G-specific adenine glycosylase